MSRGRFLNRKTIILSCVASFIIGAVLSPVAIFFALMMPSLLDSNRSGLASTDFALPPPEIPGTEIVNLDWNVFTLDGTELNFADEFTNEVVFLNFWATWCPPCLEEMPSIEKLYRQFKGRVKFACISDEDAETIQNFLDDEGYTVPIYRIMEGLAEDFGKVSLPQDIIYTEGIPATFIISAKGERVLKQVGAADWGDQAVVDFLEDLLKE